MGFATSSDFQCPDTGVPVVLVWNTHTREMTAKICWFTWNLWKEDSSADLNTCKELEKETIKWCNKFHEYARNEWTAQYIAGTYDCYF